MFSLRVLTVPPSQGWTPYKKNTSDFRTRTKFYLLPHSSDGSMLIQQVKLGLYDPVCFFMVHIIQTGYRWVRLVSTCPNWFYWVLTGSNRCLFLPKHISVDSLSCFLFLCVFCYFSPVVPVKAVPPTEKAPSRLLRANVKRVCVCVSVELCFCDSYL